MWCWRWKIFMKCYQIIFKKPKIKVFKHLGFPVDFFFMRPVLTECHQKLMRLELFGH